MKLVCMTMHNQKNNKKGKNYIILDLINYKQRKRNWTITQS